MLGCRADHGHPAMYSIQDQLLDVVKEATQNVCYNSEDEKDGVHGVVRPRNVASEALAVSH